MLKGGLRLRPSIVIRFICLLAHLSRFFFKTSANNMGKKKKSAFAWHVPVGNASGAQALSSSSMRHKAKCENRHFTSLPSSSISAMLSPILTLPSVSQLSAFLLATKAGSALHQANLSIISHPFSLWTYPGAPPGTTTEGIALKQLIRSLLTSLISIHLTSLQAREDAGSQGKSHPLQCHVLNSGCS